MRIITGKYKGRTLRSVRHRAVRPATDRVKTTIFDLLQTRLPLAGAEVLDLFAGSGSLGFEAISRGAAHATFVESDRLVLEAIRANAERLGCIGQCRIVRDDAVGFIRQEAHPYNLVFADPPYAYPGTPELPSLIFDRGLLAADGFCIIEHTRHTKFGPSPLYRMILQKEFGTTCISFLTHP